MGRREIDYVKFENVEVLIDSEFFNEKKGHECLTAENASMHPTPVPATPPTDNSVDRRQKEDTAHIRTGIRLLANGKAQSRIFTEFQNYRHRCLWRRPNLVGTIPLIETLVLI
jgi:hypothetical protein